MTTGDGRRVARVAERIRMEISELLQRGELRDPRVRDVIVSDVRLSADLQIARIYVRLLEDSSSKLAQKRHASLVDVLNRASGYLRRHLGRTLQLRRIPEIEFFWDDMVDQALRMETLLGEIGTSESGVNKGSVGEGSVGVARATDATEGEPQPDPTDASRKPGSESR